MRSTPRGSYSSTSFRTLKSASRIQRLRARPLRLQLGWPRSSTHFSLRRQESVEGRAVVSEHIPLHSKRVGKNAQSARLVDEVRRQKSVLL